MIPAEAVEVVAKAMFAGSISAAAGGVPWESQPENRMKDAYRKEARAALEAAAPYMLADMLENAANATAPNENCITARARKKRAEFEAARAERKE